MGEPEIMKVHDAWQVLQISVQKLLEQNNELTQTNKKLRRKLRELNQ